MNRYVHPPPSNALLGLRSDTLAKLTNETMGRFRSKLGIFVSGSNPMFKDVAKANAMRNQPYMLHHIERKLVAYSGGSSRGMFVYFPLFYKSEYLLRIYYEYLG